MTAVLTTTLIALAAAADAGAARFEIGQGTVREGASGSTRAELEILLERGEISQTSRTLTYRLVSGSATAGRDFEAADGSIKVAPQQSRIRVPVRILGDLVRENTERFGVRLTIPLPNRTSDLVSTPEATIFDDDDRTAMYVERGSYLRGQRIEGDSGTKTMSLEIRRDGPTDQRASAVWSTVDGTAKAGSDYVAVAGRSVAFAAGETSRTVTVSLVGDKIKEAETETFSVALSQPSGVDLLGDPEEFAIVDNDNDDGFRVDSTSLTEGAAGATANMAFLVTRTGPRDTAATVSWSTASGGTSSAVPATEDGYAGGLKYEPTYRDGGVTAESPATAGTDYLTRSGTLSFAPGESQKTVLVPIIGDDVPEGEESLRVTLSGATGAPIASNFASGVGRIIDEDAGFAAGDVTLVEGPRPTTTALFGSAFAPAPRGDRSSAEQPAQVTIYRTGKTDRFAQVNWDLENGSAVAGADFAGDFGVVYFAPGETRRTVPLTLRSDLVPEQTESFRFDLSEAIGAGVADPSATVTITDDDGLLVDDAAVTETTSGTSIVQVPVRLTGPSTSGVTVRWATETAAIDVKEGTDATAGIDYVTNSGAVTFAPGETAKLLPIAIKGDTVNEKTETFLVRLSGASGAVLVDDTARIDITNAAQGFKIGDAEVLEGDTGVTKLAFEVRRVGPSTATQSVTWSTTAPPAATEAYADDFQVEAYAAAAAGSDFRAAGPTTLTFAPGETTRTVTVDALGDTAVEPPENVGVTLRPLSSATTVLDGTGVGTILPDDTSVRIVSGSALEDRDVVELAVQRLGAAAGTATVDWTTADGTAVAGLDYRAASGRVTFMPGETRRVIEVPLVREPTPEADEAFTVRLSSPTGAQLGTAVGTATITNDDGLEVSNAYVVEPATGTAQAQFTVSLTGPVATPVTVSWGTAPVNGGATAGSDYVATSGRNLRFEPGETSKSVSVAIPADAVTEKPERFAVRLSSPTGAAIVKASGAGLIVDAAAGIYVTDASVAEDGSSGRALSFEVLRSGSTGTTATVTVDTVLDALAAGGSAYADPFVPSAPYVAPATRGEDYLWTGPQQVTFAPGETVKTVTVPIDPDPTLEYDETFFLSLSAASGATILDNRGVGRIEDND